LSYYRKEFIDETDVINVTDEDYEFADEKNDIKILFGLVALNYMRRTIFTNYPAV